MNNSILNFLKKNSATILTCIGGIGVVATTVTAVKATPKAIKLIEAKTQEKGSKLTVSETIETSGMTYVPTAITGMATIACIFGANCLNKNQQAAITSAYVLLDNSYKKYKKKVNELYGSDSDKLVRKEIAKDNYERNTNLKYKRLFYDEYSERYFEADTETVIRAEYELNQDLLDTGCIYMNTFYKRVGLDPVPYGDSFDWSGCSAIEFEHTKVVMDDNLECTIISAIF